MRYSLLITVLSFSVGLKATPELSDYYFKTDYVELTVTYRYYNEIKYAQYEAMAHTLNDYVSELKDEGKLAGRKIRFEIMDAVWMDHATGAEMYRYSTAYYCYLNALVEPVTQDYLAHIIDYCAGDSWRSFVYDEEKVSPRTARRIFDEQIGTYYQTDRFEAETIWSAGGIHLLNQGDKLVVMNGDRELGEPSWYLPFEIKNRQSVVIDQTAYVYENGKVVNQITLGEYGFNGGGYYQPTKKVKTGWVDFSNEEEGYYLSYSYDRNKFYKL